MAPNYEQLKTLEENYKSEDDSVEKRIKQNRYRRKLLINLEDYVGPTQELPKTIREYMFKDLKSYKGRYLFKTQIWHLVAFFIVNQVPQELADLWAIEFQKIDCENEDKWESAWTKLKTDSNASAGYFNFDTLDFTAKYVNSNDPVQKWKEGNWGNTEGKDLQLAQSKDSYKRGGENSDRPSKFKRRE